MASESVAIGIDLGGTNLKGAAVDADGRILSKGSLPMAGESPQAVIVETVALVDRLLTDVGRDRSAMVGVGVGVPGPLSRQTGTIIRAANLPGWKNVPIRDRLADALGTTVTLDNDGNAAALGEYWVGVGEGSRDLVMLTLGTGVGAGVVLNGSVHHGHHDNAAELGHVITVVNGLPCSCGQRGCLEQYASAAAVARRVVTAIGEGEPSALAGAVREGEAIDTRQVVEWAKAGDPLCLRIWDDCCLHLAIACITIQHAYNPADIVLGGGMSEAGDFLLERVKEHLAGQCWTLCDDLPEISLAKLGYDAGVIGAARLAWITSNNSG